MPVIGGLFKSCRLPAVDPVELFYFRFRPESQKEKSSSSTQSNKADETESTDRKEPKLDDLKASKQQKISKSTNSNSRRIGSCQLPAYGGTARRNGEEKRLCMIFGSLMYYHYHQ